MNGVDSIEHLAAIILDSWGSLLLVIVDCLADDV
jgi:hypothetical protein